MPGCKGPERDEPAASRCECRKRPQHPGPLATERTSREQERRERKRPLMSLYHEVMEALTPLIDAFEQLGITYYIGGSVSSSLHGLARRTQDVDVIADIGINQVRSLVQALQSDYYVDEQAWKDAVRRG